MRKFLWAFGLLTFLLFAGCGQQAAPPNGGGGNHVTAPQRVATTLQAADTQLYKITQPLSEVGFPVPLVPILLSEGVAPLDTATWNCSSVTVTGNLTDADNDGIPVNATFNGACTWSYSGSGGNASGSWRYKNLNVQDPNDHDPEAGIKAKGEVDWSFTAGGESLSWTWNIAQHDFVKQGSGYNFTYKGSWTFQTSGGTYTEHYDLSGTWTPDDPNNPWGDGVLSAEGSFSGSGPGCAGWSLRVNLTSLHYQGNKIVGGSASFSGTDCDGNSSSVSITWSPTQVCITASGHTYCVSQ